jgi:hypothetical protein
MAEFASGQIVIADWRDALPKKANKLRPSVVIEDADLFSPVYPNVILVPLTEDAGMVFRNFRCGSIRRPRTAARILATPSRRWSPGRRSRGCVRPDPASRRSNSRASAGRSRLPLGWNSRRTMWAGPRRGFGDDRGVSAQSALCGCGFRLLRVAGVPDGDAGGVSSRDPAAATIAPAASARSGKGIESDADLTPMPHEVNCRNTVAIILSSPQPPCS